MKPPDWIFFLIRQLSRSRGSILIIILLTILAALCGAAAPLFIGRMMDAITVNSGKSMNLIAIMLLGALLFSEICTALRTYISTKTMVGLSYKLSAETLASILHTSSDFFTKTSRGEIIQRCTQDAKVIQRFGLSTLPSFAQEVLLALFALAVIVQWNWVLAMILLGAFIILFIPVQLYGRKRGVVRKQLTAHDARLRQSLLEKLETIKLTKIFGNERKEFETFSAEQQQWEQLMYRDGIVDSVYRTFPRIPDSLAPALVFIFAGWQMASGQATVGQLVTIIAFIPAINAPVRSFFGLYVSLADIKVRIHGLMEYLQLPIEPGQKEGLSALAHIRGQSISFVGVHAAGERAEVLRELNFTIAPGEHVAIVGPSGAGKSTVLKLLLRMQEPSSGDIYFGSTPLRMLDASHLRRQLGYVAQESTWFRDSLLRNLTYFKEAGRETLDKWMHVFGLEEMISSLPTGYDAELTSNGEPLSGGQRQLISIARTLLKDPDLILFDEATSALDQKSESEVVQALNEHASHITKIIVTHRLHTAAMADRILVFDQGQLVEEGTHKALLNNHGTYAKLWHQEIIDNTPTVLQHIAKEGAVS